jgi:hypothetical protein
VPERRITRQLIRFPIAEPLETVLVAATELDRAQLEQLRDQVLALLEAPPAPVASAKAMRELVLSLADGELRQRRGRGQQRDR